LLSDISQKIKACRQKAKIEKMVLQNSKNLRESAAEKQPAPKPPAKKREKRYAQKRSVDGNPE
jgi:hypothetical protein